MNKDKFDRGIGGEFVSALNREYRNGGWWKNLVEDKSLFLGIRDDIIHVYFRGGRILELKYSDNEFGGKTHFKYLINLTRDNEKRDYVEFKKGLYDDVNLDDAYHDIEVDLARIKRSANTYQGEEKKGVHEIIMHNRNVIDTEIQLPGEDRRIDFAALQKMDDKIGVVFFEAKTYSNQEIRSRGRPDVLDQIEAYENILSRRKTEIEEAYKQVANNIHNIRGWGNRRSDIFEDAVTSNLIVDPKVRLVIFGFDDAQKKNAEQANGIFGKLRHYLGEKLVLAKGRPQKFVRGIGSPD